MYKIERGGGSKNPLLGNYQDFFISGKFKYDNHHDLILI